MRLIDVDKQLVRLYRLNLSCGDTIKAFLLTAPTVDSEPIRHGYWKPFDLSWGRSIYSCTNCGTAMEVPREMGEPIYNYCPYCGARMDGELKKDILADIAKRVVDKVTE